jgi:crotonobetainyl-CoA:carnitine CoA-transferase CaiB-like acyl-CoA transferase
VGGTTSVDVVGIDDVGIDAVVGAVSVSGNRVAMVSGAEDALVVCASAVVTHAVSAVSASVSVVSASVPAPAVDHAARPAAATPRRGRIRPFIVRSMMTPGILPIAALVASPRPDDRGTCHDDLMGPLDGVKVVDFSVMISGPLAGMMLADQGADVVKVETPGFGDIMRLLGSSKNGMTGIFANNNRGKRSLVVNLKSDDGRDVVRRLLEGADVVIQNFRPGAMARLGLGYDEVKEINPNLIYTSISGYGPTGPSSNRRVYDNVIQAASGLASVQTDPATGEPSMFRTLLCDKTTAYTAAQAITAALFARATGKAAGQHIDIAMLDTAIAFMWPDSAMDAVLLDDDAQRQPTIGSNYGVTRLADGFASAAAVTDDEFKALCATYDRAELAEDPRFADTLSRMANVTEMVALIAEAAAACTLDEFVDRSAVHDVPASRINTLDDLPSDPQVINNEVFVEREHPMAGRLREPRPAARLTETPQCVGRVAPAHGEHTDEIVAELGLDAEQLRAAGAIG